MAGCCVPVKGKVQAHSTQSESRRLIKRSKRLKNVVGRSAFQKWQFRKSAGSPMRKIQPAMCSESLSRIRMPANRKENKMSSNTIRLHRVLRASPEKIYRAFLDPDAMAK